MKKSKSVKKRHPLPVTGAYDKTSPRFGFQEWSIRADLGGEILKQIIGEALAIATEDYECIAYFAAEYNETTPPADPTRIHVELPLGQNEDENPRWVFTLTGLVDSLIELNEHGDGENFDEDFAPVAIAVRDELRALADRIDARLPRSAGHE